MAYNKITLYGEQTCDYLYIQNDVVSEDSFTSVNDEPSEWNDSTTLYANFNDTESPLIAGDSGVAGSIEGYQIFRKKYNESHSEYIGEVKKSNQGLNDLTIDYTVKNGVDYTYYLYPNAEKSEGGVALSPLITDQLSIDCPYWALFIVDETDEENIFYLDKMFKFELNIEVGDMTNNADVTVTQNFTPYPTLQHGASNYWSGSLSALCGFISTNDIDYIQTPNMIYEIKQISSDTRRKFLKDIDGNLWEVDVSAPTTIATETITLKSLKTWNLSWIEVGDASGISIVNNPTKPTTDWVLTENGVLVPYFTYQWDEQYKWDNSYLWTAHDDIYEVQNSNLGRKITE